MRGEGKVKCCECVYAQGYNPMYVGGDCRKWGTSVCTRLARRRRVDTLGGYDGCNKGVSVRKAVSK